MSVSRLINAMRIHKYLKLALWIIGYLAVSFAIGQLTQGSIQGWYQDLEKPSFNPPNFIFPIVWSLLYVMVAIAGWTLWRVDATKQLKIIFIVYTLMNWAWTPLFFGAQQIALGFFWIMIMNLINIIFIIRAWPIVRLSAVLMIPLLVWTLFASLLNYNIWILNL